MRKLINKSLWNTIIPNGNRVSKLANGKRNSSSNFEKTLDSWFIKCERARDDDGDSDSDDKNFDSSVLFGMSVLYGALCSVQVHSACKRRIRIFSFALSAKQKKNKRRLLHPNAKYVLPFFRSFFKLLLLLSVFSPFERLQSIICFAKIHWPYSTKSNQILLLPSKLLLLVNSMWKNQSNCYTIKSTPSQIYRFTIHVWTLLHHWFSILLWLRLHTILYVFSRVSFGIFNK